MPDEKGEEKALGPQDPGPRLTPEKIRERLTKGARHAAALDEQLDEVFVLRDASSTLKLTVR